MYAGLSAKEKEVYDTLREMAENMYGLGPGEKHILNPVGQFASAEEGGNALRKAWFAMMNDHPEIFWLPPGYYAEAYKYSNENDFYFSVGFHYTDEETGEVLIQYPLTKAQRDSRRTALENKVTEILNEVGGGLSEYERELEVFRLLCKTVKYDWTTYNAVRDTGGVLTPQIRRDAFTAYGALVEGSAVCEGYARAFQFLMHQAGIECTLVTGSSVPPEGGTSTGYNGHMWNAVKIGGNWYQVDVTWGDRDDDTPAKYKPTRINYEYFNVSDAIMKLSHEYDPDYPASGADPNASYNLNLPVCNSFAENYYVKNGQYLQADNSTGISTVVAKVVEAYNRGENNIGFMFSSKSVRDAYHLIKRQTIFNQVKTQLGLQTLSSSAHTSGQLGLIFQW